MSFERKIKYLDYMLHGVKHSPAGFVKFEVREQCLCMKVHLRGLKNEGDGNCRIYLQSKESEEMLGNMQLQSGEGHLQLPDLDILDVGGCGIAFCDLVAIRISLPGSGEVCGIINDRTTVTVATENMGQSPEEPVKEESVIHDSKWKQLSAIYPHIAPFQDEREYLSIGPQDFVILPDKVYRRVNNSFLLHGYYNYKHLILKQVDYHGENRYYIGVPGTFYDREKQVAVMFGFENFESRKESAEPGDYGYYLMRIEM